MEKKFVFFCITVIIFLLFLQVASQAWGFSQGEIQEMNTEFKTRYCEIKDLGSLETPVIFNIDFPTVVPEILLRVSGAGQSQYKSTEFITGEERSRYEFNSLNSTEKFVLDFRLPYNQTSFTSPFNIYYVIFQNENDLVELGNWQHKQRQAFCRIYEFNTVIPEKTRTEEETISLLAGWEEKQHKKTHDGLIGVIDITALQIIIIVVGFGVIGIDRFIIYMARNKISDEDNTRRKAMSKAINDLRDTRKLIPLSIIDMEAKFDALCSKIDVKIHNLLTVTDLKKDKVITKQYVQKIVDDVMLKKFHAQDALNKMSNYQKFLMTKSEEELNHMASNDALTDDEMDEIIEGDLFETNEQELQHIEEKVEGKVKEKGIGSKAVDFLKDQLDIETKPKSPMKDFEDSLKEMSYEDLLELHEELKEKTIEDKEDTESELKRQIVYKICKDRMK